MLNRMLFILICALCPWSLWAASPAPANAKVYFISPANGAEVTNPVTVVFGLKGMGVAPAGVDKPNTGHHHLLVDVDPTPSLDKPIIKDDKHQHFGAGQTEASLTLSPGTHTLQLIFADKDHLPHQPALVSEKITIKVK